MQLLTTRSGELVFPVEPLCDDPGCIACAGLFGTDSAQPVELATVADRPDTRTTALVSAAEGLLKRTGWVKDPEMIAEYAFEMAALSIRVAGWYPPGTKVRAAFDRDTDEWIITTHANQSATARPHWLDSA